MEGIPVLRAAWSIRPKAAEDDTSLRRMARAIPDWFRSEDAARVERNIGAHSGLVAVQGGDVVGFLTYDRGEEPGSIEITSLAVRPDLRRRGVAASLCGVLENLLRQSGCRAVLAATHAETVAHPPAEASRRFYHRRGYVTVRVDPAYWGAGADRLLLRLPLSRPE